MHGQIARAGSGQDRTHSLGAILSETSSYSEHMLCSTGCQSNADPPLPMMSRKNDFVPTRPSHTARTADHPPAFVVAKVPGSVLGPDVAAQPRHSRLERKHLFTSQWVDGGGMRFAQAVGRHGLGYFSQHDVLRANKASEGWADSDNVTCPDSRSRSCRHALPGIRN